jgi:hypothetical protein
MWHLTNSCRDHGAQNSGALAGQEKPERPRWTPRLTDLRDEGGLPLGFRVRLEHALASRLLRCGVAEGSRYSR